MQVAEGGTEEKNQERGGVERFFWKWKGFDLGLFPLSSCPPLASRLGRRGGGGVRGGRGPGVGGPGALCPISRKRRRGSVVPFFLGLLLTPFRQETFAFGEIRERVG